MLETKVSIPSNRGSTKNVNTLLQSFRHGKLVSIPSNRGSTKNGTQTGQPYRADYWGLNPLKSGQY